MRKVRAKVPGCCIENRAHGHADRVEPHFRFGQPDVRKRKRAKSPRFGFVDRDLARENDACGFGHANFAAASREGRRADLQDAGCPYGTHTDINANNFCMTANGPVSD